MLNGGDEEIASEETEQDYPDGLTTKRSIEIYHTLIGKLTDFKPEDVYELISYCNALALKERYELIMANSPMTMHIQKALSLQIATVGSLAKRLKIGAASRNKGGNQGTAPRLTFKPRSA